MRRRGLLRERLAGLFGARPRRRSRTRRQPAVVPIEDPPAPDPPPEDPGHADSGHADADVVAAEPAPAPAPAARPPLTLAPRDLGACIADFDGFPSAGVLQISCGYNHTGGWRSSLHRGWDLAIPSGAAKVIACADGWVVLADEVDAAATAAGDPRAFNAGAGRYAILVYPYRGGFIAQRLLHLLDIEDRFSGGGEVWTAQPIKVGEVLGVVGGNANEDVGAGFSYGAGHLHTDLKFLVYFDPAAGFGPFWKDWGAAEYLDPAEYLAEALGAQWTLDYPEGWNS